MIFPQRSEEVTENQKHTEDKPAWKDAEFLTMIVLMLVLLLLLSLTSFYP